jgi:uncharacterized repeat protein (TIGR04076 family)
MNYSACGMKPGDYFEVGPEGFSLPAGQHFCYFAVASVLPVINGRLGGQTDDTWPDSAPLLQCPDPPEGLYMRLEPAPEQGAST